MGRKIRVILTNRVAQFSPNLHQQEKQLAIRKYFTYKNPGAYFSLAFKSGAWDGSECLFKNLQLTSGLFLARKADMEKAGHAFYIKDNRVYPKFQGANQSDRAYQNDCVRIMAKHSNCGGTILGGTGTGKTYIAALYFRKLIGAAVFICDERTLARQSQKEIEKHLGEPVGFIGDGVWDPKRITVALPHTLKRRIGTVAFLKWSANIEVMIVDEMHSAANTRTNVLIRALNPLAVFGLTATLDLAKRPKRLLAFQTFGPVIFDFDYQKGLAENVLVPGIVVNVNLARSHPAKFDAEQLYRLFITDDKERNRFIAKVARESVARGYHTAILVDRPDHVRNLSGLLKDIPHNTVFGARSVAHRIASQARFEDGFKQLLIANRVFKKGINIKVLDLIIDGAGLGNADDAIQKFGRGTRLSTNKAGLIYIDVGDYLPKGSEFDFNKFKTWTSRRRRAFRERLKVPVFVKKAEDQTVQQLLTYAEDRLKSIAV